MALDGMSHFVLSVESKIWDNTDMPQRILIAAHEVVPFLETIELDRDGLHSIVMFADSERSQCTANDVRGWEKQIVYDKLARGLRDLYCGPRWEKDEYENQGGIRNPHLKIRVIPCNFDHHAGNPGREPTNRVEKGEASRKKTRCNKTPWLLGLAFPEPLPNEYMTYILGMYAERDEPVGAELSLPLSFEGGKYGLFAKRVMLVSEDDPPGAKAERPDRPGPVDIVDIAVNRK